MLKTFKNTEDGILVILLKWIALRILPTSVCNWLGVLLYGSEYRLSLGSVRFGNLRRVKPISRQFGFDRGLPIDRNYIEQFLSCHQDDIRGHVLEVAQATYTKQFGGDQVHTSDVLHSPIGVISPAATIVADLTDAKHIAENTFDCIILTQTLLFIYDLKAAIQTLHRILKPGGVILVTVPGISQIIREDMETWGEYWRFTRHSLQRIFSEIFIRNSIHVYS